MKFEKSCGAVVYTKENGLIKYVIIQSKNGVFGFPKGHVEKNETESATALREIREETGLNVKLIDGFKEESSYCFTLNGEEITKNVIYFLGEYNNQTPVAQETELNGIFLMDYNTAISVFQFDNLKQTLTRAHTFLTNK